MSLGRIAAENTPLTSDHGGWAILGTVYCVLALFEKINGFKIIGRFWLRIYERWQHAKKVENFSNT